MLAVKSALISGCPNFSLASPLLLFRIRARLILLFSTTRTLSLLYWCGRFAMTLRFFFFFFFLPFLFPFALFCPLFQRPGPLVVLRKRRDFSLRCGSVALFPSRVLFLNVLSLFSLAIFSICSKNSFFESLRTIK